jgi:hypothetical protein
LSVIWLHTFNNDVIMVANVGILTQAIVNSNSGDLAELVAANLDLSDQVPVMRVKELALKVARCSPYTYLKKPVTVIVEPCFEYRGLLRFTIKAYVLDVVWNTAYKATLTSDSTNRSRVYATCFSTRGIRCIRDSRKHLQHGHAAHPAGKPDFGR